MSRYDELKEELKNNPKVWLVTGCAGFIGSNLLETLLLLDQYVVGLDNFSTGYQHNLDEVAALVAPRQWQRFHFLEGDIRNLEICRAALTHPAVRDGIPSSVDYVLHQAALGSVPRSINDPIASNETNVSGFLNMLVAGRDAGVQSFTYAASSSTYGDHPDLPKVEKNIGNPLSPYAVTKYVNELYADVFARCYGFKCIGLRYFNVFGKRQDPNGAYAAVIPKWIAAMINNETVYINGDGETSRDFCFVDNAVQANLLAAAAGDTAKNEVYNVAVGDRTTLNVLFKSLQNTLAIHRSTDGVVSPVYSDFRDGDVRHSQADITKISNGLRYQAKYRIDDGISLAMPWYLENL